MNNELKIEQSMTNNIHSTVIAEKSGEEIYISDECGDTMWDAVLAQQDKLEASGNTDKITGEHVAA